MGLTVLGKEPDYRGNACALTRGEKSKVNRDMGGLKIKDVSDPNRRGQKYPFQDYGREMTGKKTGNLF